MDSCIRAITINAQSNPASNPRVLAATPTAIISRAFPKILFANSVRAYGLSYNNPSKTTPNTISTERLK